MEVVIDTDVFMNAIFDQPKNEDCWEILKLVRSNEITPVVSEGLLREYVFVPAKIGFEKLQDMFDKGKLVSKDFNIIKDDVYYCSSTMMKIITSNSKLVEVTSNLSVCTLDHGDDKLVNLAVDSNCTKIITKNIDHLKDVEDKGIKNKSGKPIEVMTPEVFTQCFKLQRHFNNKSTAKKR